MSYSFNLRVATIAAVAAAVATKFDEVVATQPVHAKDREVAIATATSVAGLVGEPGENQEVSVSVNGWVQWHGALAAGEVPDELTGASVSVTVGIVPKTE